MGVPAVQSGQTITPGMTEAQYQEAYPDSENFDTFDTDGDGTIELEEIQQWDTNNDGRIDESDLDTPNTIAGAQVLTDSDMKIFSMLLEADAILDYLMEKIRKSANESNTTAAADPAGATNGLTQEQIDTMMKELFDYYCSRGLDPNKISKADFKLFLKAASEKFGWNLTDDQINDYADELINNNWLGLNTRNWDDVKAFLVEKGLYPKATAASTAADPVLPTAGLTQEDIDTMMEEIIAYYTARGLDPDKISKGDFKLLLKSISEKFGLGLTDDAINDFADKLINNNWLGLNTRTIDQVKTFLKENGLWPQPTAGTPGTTGTNSPTASPIASRNFNDTDGDGRLSAEELASQPGGPLTDPRYVPGMTLDEAEAVRREIAIEQNSIPDPTGEKWCDPTVERIAEFDQDGNGKLSDWEIADAKLDPNKYKAGMTVAQAEELAQARIDGTWTPEWRPISGGGDYDFNRSGWYNNYKAKIDGVSDFSSSSMGLWVSNLVNKITTFITTLVSLGTANTKMAESIGKKTLP